MIDMLASRPLDIRAQELSSHVSLTFRLGFSAALHSSTGTPDENLMDPDSRIICNPTGPQCSSWLVYAIVLSILVGLLPMLVSTLRHIYRRDPGKASATITD